VELGRASEQRGDPAAAISFYRRAIAIDPDVAEAHNNLGVLLAGQGLYAEAAEQFRAAVRLRPRDALALRNLALALERSGDLPGALEQYEAAVRAEPGNAETRAMRDSALRGRRP
jgi:tetratricopeptide (TPR) repeat protein